MAQYVASKGVHLWIRHVLVPSLTDDADGLRALDAFIKNAADRAPGGEFCPTTRWGCSSGRIWGFPYPLDGVRVPTAEEIAAAGSCCMSATTPMRPRIKFYKIVGIIFGKTLDITALVW